MPSSDGALDWLCAPGSEVSSHYLIDESGKIIQLVPEARRAWHAGASGWKGERDLNSASIGIEVANAGHDGGCPPFAEAQIEAVIALCQDICRRHSIVKERVLAHSDVAPKRKRDPGEHFPWDRLANSGVGHWVSSAPIVDGPIFALGEGGRSMRALQAMLALYGYNLELTGVNDAQTRVVVAAFQRHFRPARVDGEIDSSTVETLRTLQAALKAS
jgi:N-acetylmuramoyl-L-alanine amidase